MPRKFRRCRPDRLYLEALEDRTLLAAAINGSVWHDLNGDGVRAGEPGLAGVTVFLDDGSHTFDGSQPHTLTNGSGDYSFANLPAGGHTVSLVVPQGGTLTFPAAATFQNLNVADGQTAGGIDFGVQADASAQANDLVTNDTGVQQMPSVAVNPLDANHVVMAYMDYSLLATGYAGIRVSVSQDAGATWQQSSIPLPAGFDQAAGHPIVQFDATGKVHVSFMAATFLGKDSNGADLKPGIIYDTTSQTVSYLNKSVSRREFGTHANNGVFVATSSDGGLTWDRVQAVAAQRYDQTFTSSPIGVATGSQVVTPAVMPANLFLNKTLIIDEGLASMERVRVTAVTATSFTATFAKAHSPGFTISTPVFFDAQPDLAIDTNPASPFFGNLYATWTRFYPAGQFPGRALIAGAPGLGGTEIMLAVSTDGGQTWTTRLQTVSGVQRSAVLDPLSGATGGSSATATEGSGTVTLPRVAVGPEGGVYITQFAGNRFPVFYSGNAGAAFRNPVPGVGAVTYADGYPFGLDSNDYTAIYPVGASGASFVPASTLFNNQFRTQAVRQIVADPSRAGTVYAVESVQIITTAGVAIDAGEVTFSRSEDFGQTWNRLFTVGPNAGNLSELPANLQFRYRGVLNDDNATRFTGFDATLVDEIISGQALPQMSVDAQGNIAVVWYDTRRDPANRSLDVYGTVSTDRGLTFSSNYRITGTNFDANVGAFTDARNAQNFYLGDRIGLAVAGGTVYAAWTDTRRGNQDIFFSRYGLAPAAPAFNDRFEANNSPQTATDLGQVTAQRVVPRLSVPQGDEDWFSLQAGATGQLVIQAAAAVDGNTLQLELWDSTGTTRLAVGTAAVENGQVVGQQIQFPSVSGTRYLIHVLGATLNYSLVLQSLTADLGTSVQGSVDDALAANGKDVFRLVAAVGGSLEFTLAPGGTAQGNLNVQVLSADGQTVLANGTLNPGAGQVERIGLPVDRGQAVLLQVSSVTTASVVVNGAAVILNLGTPGAPVTFSKPSSGIVTLQVAGNKPLNVRFTRLNSTATGAVNSVQDLTLQPGVPVNFNIAALPGAGGYRLEALDAAGSGPYHLDFTNLDIFQTTRNTSLFFPTGGSSSSIVAADVNLDNQPDLVLTSTQGGDLARVMLGNADGTFQAPQQYAVGSGQAAISPREPLVEDFTGDNVPDLVVPNYFAADVSILAGLGDGTFAPQRRSDAVFQASSVAAADFDGDGIKDLAVLDRVAGSVTLAILSGRNDGTFEPPQRIQVPSIRGDAFPVRAGDLDGVNGPDLVVFTNDSRFQVVLNNGNGTFALGQTFSTGEVAFFDALLADLNGDRNLDVVIGGGNNANVIVLQGNGNGTFGDPVAYATVAPRAGDNQGIVGLAVVDFGGAAGPGTADRKLDVVVTTRSRSGTTPPQAFFLPGQAPDANGRILGTAQRLATLKEAGRIAVGDFNQDGVKDLAITEAGGVRVTYSQAPVFMPNTTPATARNLGTVTHYLSPTQAIVTGFQDVYFRLTVPVEAVAGAGSQVVDFSALFENVQGAGLEMEVTDLGGVVLGSGSRFRVVAEQGQELLVRIFGQPAAGGLAQGTGVYTLDIDVLPQVVSVQAQSALPGGPATSIVVTLQGDRLDATAAQNPAHYTVTWLGADGQPGTFDDRVIQPAALGGQAVVYNPGANVNVASGQSAPTAVRQTVTLLFDQPLPAGSYLIELSPNIQAAALNDAEAGLLAGGAAFAGHPVVSTGAGAIANGSQLFSLNLVAAGGAPNNAINQGTPFLTQFHSDLGALLDQLLNAGGDNAAITGVLNQFIVDRFGPGVNLGTLAIIWLDPVSIDLADSQGARTIHDLQSNQVSNTGTRTFLATGTNTQVIVMAGVQGGATLSIADVQPTARGGAVVFNGGQVQTTALTDAIRAGTRTFQFTFPQAGDAATAVAAQNGPAGSSTSTLGSAVFNLSNLSLGTLALALTLTQPANSTAEGLQTGETTAPPGGTGTAASSAAGSGTGAPGSGGGNESEGAEEHQLLTGPEAERRLRIALSILRTLLGNGMGGLVGQINSFVAVLQQLLRTVPAAVPADEPEAGAAKPAPDLPAPAAPANVDAVWAEPVPEDIAGLLLEDAHAPAPVLDRQSISLSALLIPGILAAGLAPAFARHADNHRDQTRERKPRLPRD